jgi:putative sterol carrier protein
MDLNDLYTTLPHPHGYSAPDLVPHQWFTPNRSHMSHQFLSDEWMTAAKAIREKYAHLATKVTTSIRMNQVITEVPFGSGTVSCFIDTSSGDVVMDLGELDTPDLTVTTDWATARKIFVDGDQAAGMQAFMSGKIKVTGDMMKMMQMQTSMPQDDTAKQIAAEIQAITA